MRDINVAAAAVVRYSLAEWIQCTAVLQRKERRSSQTASIPKDYEGREVLFKGTYISRKAKARLRELATRPEEARTRPNLHLFRHVCIMNDLSSIPSPSSCDLLLQQGGATRTQHACTGVIARGVAVAAVKSRTYAVMVCLLCDGQIVSSKKKVLYG